MLIGGSTTSLNRARSAVVVVGPLPPPVHGAANVTASVARELARTNADTLVIDTGIDTAPLLLYHARRILRHFAALSVIWRLRSSPLRSVYIAGAGGAGMWYQAIILTVARALRYRIAFHHHSYAYVNQPSVAMHAITRAAGRNALHVVLCSRMSTDLRRRYPRAQQTLIVSNSLPPVADPTPDVGSSSITVGHMSNLSVAKGLLEVLTAFRALQLAAVDARLFLAGPPADHVTRDIIAAAEVEFGDRLVYWGLVGPGRRADFLKSVDVFIAELIWVPS